jgi:hypothetical protein
MTRHDAELRCILEAERLDSEGPEMREVQRTRAEVEGVIRDAFGTTGLTIRYGGSKAKGMMLKCSYDLDLLIYFHRDNDAAGSTLPAIYNSVADVLGGHYQIDPGTTAIRLHAKNAHVAGPGLCVDAVPGRFIDVSRTNVWLHQKDADKHRLMTDPDEHIRFVRDSGVVDPACLLKLWRVDNRLVIRQFPFEILCVDLLKPMKHLGLADQITRALGTISGMQAAPSIKDPANPDNDLSRLLTPDVWADLCAAASQTVDNHKWQGWSGIFMTEPIADAEVALAAAVKSVHVATKPWCT